MDKTPAERQNQIYALAENDLPYQVWRDSYEHFRDAFTQYANRQPAKIRNLLYGYAEGGRMMNQRLVNLCCQNMVFPDE